MTHYDTKTFTDIYNQLSNQPLPPNFNEKVSYYIKTFHCFNSFYDPKMIWEKKKFSKKEKTQKNRFHIIIPDFTKESQTKRQLTSYLNKLSTKNQNNIYEKMREIISANNEDEYFQLVWSYVKTTDNDLYLNILYFFDTNLMQRNIDLQWNIYIKDKLWLPPDYIMQNDILRLNDEYDMYCDYTKWKKEVSNIHMAWFHLKKDVSILLNDIYEYFAMYIQSKNTYKHVIDIFLENIDKLLTVNPNPQIVENIKQLDINRFESSSKFLIYNIVDKNK